MSLYCTALQCHASLSSLSLSFHPLFLPFYLSPSSRFMSLAVIHSQKAPSFSYHHIGLPTLPFVTRLANTKSYVMAKTRWGWSYQCWDSFLGYVCVLMRLKYDGSGVMRRRRRKGGIYQLVNMAPYCT